jgi:hypothetical protein
MLGVNMEIVGKTRTFLCFVSILLAAGVLISASAGFSGDTPKTSRSVAQEECTFSDGGTIAFGQKAGEESQPGDNFWSTGPYKATAFRVSEPMAIPPLNEVLRIPAGSYTLFVIDKGEPPWTLIVSKKAGEWGMAYPGEKYDLGRTDMGSDVAPPVEKFTVGCMNFKNTGGPIFLWMQSGRRVAYDKIMAEKVTDGTIEYLVH